MLKVELDFDTSLPVEIVNKYCDETDRIFAEEGIKCIETGFGKRIYVDDRKECNLADAGMALVEIRDNVSLCNSVTRGMWITDTEINDIVKEFFHK